MITEIEGSLLDDTAEALVNTVNCGGIMGKGIAKSFKRKYPKMFDTYAYACKRGEVTIGKMHVYSVEKPNGAKYIINFPTKTIWQEDSQMSFIEAGLVDLVQLVQDLKIKSIAIPPLGCGNGGLDWSKVKLLIIEAFALMPDVDVRIYAKAKREPPVDTRDKLLIVDGSSFLYRAYYGTNPMYAIDGFKVNTIYGVISMLHALRTSEDPKYLVCVFDEDQPNFRHALHPTYKANRPPMPADLRKQLDILRILLPALGWPVVAIKGVEADDIMGTLAKQIKGDNMRCVIATGDKDIAQIVDDDIILLNTMTDDYMWPDNVVHKFGVVPEKIIDLLAIVGDVSDNIPGLPYVGYKTAAKWLNAHGTLENLITFPELINDTRFKDITVTYKARLCLNKILVTIKYDIDPMVHYKELTFKQPDVRLLTKWFLKLGFTRWAKALKRL